MNTYTVYVKMVWHGTVLYNSYYIVPANSEKEARKSSRTY